MDLKAKSKKGVVTSAIKRLIGSKYKSANNVTTTTSTAVNSEEVTTTETTAKSKVNYNKESNVYEVSKIGTYKITFDTSAKTSSAKAFYYRIFTFDSLNAGGSVKYSATCKVGGRTLKNITAGLTITDIHKERSIVYKEYSTLKSCIADKKGSSTDNVTNSQIVNYKLVR